MSSLEDFNNPKLVPTSSLPELPKRIKLVDTKSFVRVDVAQMELKGDGGTSFLRLVERGVNLCSQTSLCFQYTVLHALNGRRKVSTVQRWVGELDLFFRTVAMQFGSPISTISFPMFNWYSSQKNASQQKLLRSALLYWSNLRLPGVASDLTDYLVTSSSPRPRQTIEIQNSVAHERPFKLTEIRRILAAIDDLYIAKEFTPQDNLLWRLIVSEALRPSQLRLLQLGDVTFESVNAEKLSRANLKVPVVKQSGTSARDYMLEVRLSEPISRAMKQHLLFIEDRFGKLPAPSYPLFCITEQHGRTTKPKESSIDITSRISKTRASIARHVGDLGDHEFFTRRFKHTKLTHLAVLGAPIDVLARAGYQTSTISLRHYTNLTDEAFAEYEILMTATHDDIFNAFRGRVIDASEATNPDPSHSIVSPNLENTLGACAADPCSAFAPIACYSCPRFEAFTDGAHEIVLDFLLARQRMAKSIELPAETIERDTHLIAAVKHVINEIEKRKSDE